MDISVYVSELLWEHDCVIIPGFGGLICSYKPATIQPVTNLVSPPSKAISFNKNLQNNDGLLVNYISSKKYITFSETLNIIQDWVDSTNALLKNNEEVMLKKTGKLFLDVEGNLQFEPDFSVNYLKTSYGLKSFVAEPVLREGRIVTAGAKIPGDATGSRFRTVWKMAATIVLIACIAAVARMMSLGVEIKPLQLDEAGVMNFVNRIFYVDARPLNTLPVEMEVAPVPVLDESLAPVPIVHKEKKATETPVVKKEAVLPSFTTNVSHGYYIIIGAFRQAENIEQAKTTLLKDYSESEILMLTHRGLTKVGYYAGNNLTRAEEILNLAKQKDPACWLMQR